MKFKILSFLLLNAVWSNNLFAQKSTITPQKVIFPQLSSAQIGVIAGQAKDANTGWGQNLQVSWIAIAGE